MELGKTLYVKDRARWRAWLEKNHSKEKEIWLIFYRKQAGKPSLPYEDAVEEALCFGWIDSIVKKVDEERRAQRFSPRREKSNLSETNRERVRRLIEEGRMTEAGLAKLRHHLEGGVRHCSRQASTGDISDAAELPHQGDVQEQDVRNGQVENQPLA